ncbi:MAG: hypothetical protein K6G28_06420 [Acholeplasmatales bacterium]|jgi:hypothetical protein|nr:hypothetical protein [Acholeplasmatales bacterium]
MKNKKILLTLSVAGVSALALASCKNNYKTNTADNSALSLDVTKNWFMDGKDISKTQVSEVFTRAIYNPVNDEDFDKSKAYTTIYAYENIAESARMVETELTSDMTKDGVKNTVRFLQTSTFTDAYKTSFGENIYAKNDDIKKAFTTFTADVQKTSSKSLNDYGITKDKLDSENTNYLEVIYVPFFVRSYSSYSEDNTTLTLSSFVVVPVYVFSTTKNENVYNNDIAKSFADKLATFNYNKDSQTIY